MRKSKNTRRLFSLFALLYLSLPAAHAALWETVAVFPASEWGGSSVTVSARGSQFDAQNRLISSLVVTPPMGSAIPSRWVLKIRDGSGAWTSIPVTARTDGLLRYGFLQLDDQGRAYVTGWFEPSDGSAFHGLVYRCDIDRGACESLLDYQNNGTESTYMGELAFLNGAIYAVGNANRWYVLKSIDDGKTWQRVDDDQVVAGHQSASWAIGLAPNGRIYVTGFYKDQTDSMHWRVKVSDDEGVTWSQLDDFQLAPGENSGPEKLFVDPEGRLFSVGRAYPSNPTQPGVIRRYDPANQSWTTPVVFNQDGGAEIDMAAGDDQGHVFAVGTGGTAGYVLESDDSGVSWKTVGEFQNSDGSPVSVLGAVVDSLGELYVSGRQSTDGNAEAIIRHFVP